MYDMMDVIMDSNSKFDDLCRICVSSHESVSVNVFTDKCSNGQVYSDVIKECAGITIKNHKMLSSWICNLCISQLESYVICKKIDESFVLKCVRSDIFFNDALTSDMKVDDNVNNDADRQEISNSYISDTIGSLDEDRETFNARTEEKEETVKIKEEVSEMQLEDDIKQEDQNDIDIEEGVMNNEEISSNPVKMAGVKKLTREERLEKKREAERLRYQRIKDNPEKYAEQKEKERRKYLKKKEKGSIKIVKDMTPTERRKMRKIWRDTSRKYRARLALQDVFNASVTPSSLNNELEAPLQKENYNRKAVVAKKKSDTCKRLEYEIIKKQSREIQKLKTKVEQYKKILQRLKAQKNLTPNSKVNKILDSPNSRETIKNKILFTPKRATKRKCFFS